MNYARDINNQATGAADAARDEAAIDRATDPARFREQRTWLPVGMSQVPYSKGDE